MIKKFLNRVIPGTPQQILTGDSWDTARLRVDVGQTGFWEGREFRSRVKLDLAVGAQLVLKVVAPIDFIIHSQSVVLDSGAVRYRSFSESQVENLTGFTDVYPFVVPNNRMSSAPAYTRQVEVYDNGTLTIVSGQEDYGNDDILVRSSGATAQRSTTSGGISSERGVAAGTYYLVFDGVATTSSGYVYVKFEERP